MDNILNNEHLIKLLIKIVITTIVLALHIFLLVAYILVLKKLCNMVKTNTLKHNAEKVAIAIAITVILCWPVAIGQGIYVLLKWKEAEIQQHTTNQQPNYTQPYKDDYERWKEERLKEQQKND